MTARHWIVTAAAALVSLNSAAAQDLSGYEAEAEGVLQRLRGEMMREMQRAMEIGPAEAIDVCRHLAPEIEAAIEAETGWEIRRVSLRVRNPGNAPDAEERGVLMGYGLRAASGQPAETLRTLRLVDRDGAPTVHFMQATPMFDMCAACHGETIAPDVSAAIHELYPADQAVGYKTGDVRGAFSLYRRFDPTPPPSAAAVEWERIMALDLPDAAETAAGLAVSPRQGRDLFAAHCKSCHSAGDLARHVFGQRHAGGAPGVCQFLETHGGTGPSDDCAITLFLKAVAEAAPPQ